MVVIKDPKAFQFNFDLLKNKWTNDILGNEIADKIVKLVEEIIIRPEKKRRNIKQIKTTIIITEHCKKSRLLTDLSI